MAIKPVCRLCGAKQTRSIGRVPDNDYFAGRVLDVPLEGGSLWRCEACRSLFKDPILSPECYFALYEHGEGAQWNGLQGRNDFKVVGSIVRSDVGVRRVLDVGCGSGDFLASLPSTLEKFGLEPSEAAQCASMKNIKILGASAAQLSSLDQFDAIVMIDVIEHMDSPEQLLDHLIRHLSPGGLLIISTADPETAIWPFFLKARFWYAAFPEHITFPSSVFFDQFSKKCGALVTFHRRIRYRILSPLDRFLALLVQAGFWLSPRLFNSIGARTMHAKQSDGKIRRYFSPGVPGLFADHHVVVIRKPR